VKTPITRGLGKKKGLQKTATGGTRAKNKGECPMGGVMVAPAQTIHEGVRGSSALVYGAAGEGEGTESSVTGAPGDININKG